MKSAKSAYGFCQTNQESIRAGCRQLVRAAARGGAESVANGYIHLPTSDTDRYDEKRIIYGGVNLL